MPLECNQFIAPRNMNLILIANKEEQFRRLNYATEILLRDDNYDITIQIDKTSVPGLYLQDALLITQEDLESVFQTVTLKKEIESGRLDSFGRFDEIAVEVDIRNPWIDEISIRLKSKISNEDAAHNKPLKGLKVIFTHDIDMVSGIVPQCIARSIVKRYFLRREKSWFSLRQCLSPRSLLRNLERLLELEQKNGIGAWYFMLAGPYSLMNHGAFYDINWGLARNFAGRIKEAGGHFGLHGSFTARENDSYKDEADKLRRVSGMQIIAHRNHYLRFDPVKLWAQLENAGISIDSSIGFGSKIGFRAGTARAYHPYDLINDKASKVIEIPLVFMDSANHVSNLENVFNDLKFVLNAAKNVNGCVAILFHPEKMSIDERWFDFYIQVIQYCQSLGADISGNYPEV